MKKITLISTIVISSIISLPFTIGGIFGYYLGKHFTKEIFENKTKIKPLIISFKNIEIHLHHWFISFSALISIILFGYREIFLLPLYGFLGGLIVEDIYWDRKLYGKHFYWQKKWYKIISIKGR